MDQWGVLVVIGDVDTKEVDTDWVFLPHTVQHHHHLDVVVNDDGNVRVLHNGNPHTETQKHVNMRQNDPDDHAVISCVMVTHPV